MCDGKRWPIDAALIHNVGRWPVTWRRIMKTLFTALALATLIAAPAFTKSAAAARARDASQWEQNYNGYYRGYPLEDWYRTDGGESSCEQSRE
jgi:hypothetical protein